MKPHLSLEQQVALLSSRKLEITDKTECMAFLSAHNYYRFSGYARYFQIAPHAGDDDFRAGTSFDDIRRTYEEDEALRAALVRPLAQVELLLRTHTASVIAREHGPRVHYLDRHFYIDVGSGEATVESCRRDIERSRERHILHFRTAEADAANHVTLPVWSAVEAFSFGTLSRCIERGARGSLADSVAESLGVAKAGFAYRVRSLVYLRNRCAHHARLWHHSVIDAGPTPNNVRAKAKRLAGQFEHRSVLDVVASLDDLLRRGSSAQPVLPELLHRHDRSSEFWRGLSAPQAPVDHRP